MRRKRNYKSPHTNWGGMSERKRLGYWGYESWCRKESWDDPKNCSHAKTSTPFPQKLVKRNKEGKYHRFTTILKRRSINFSLNIFLKNMYGYAKFMKDLLTKKWAINFLRMKKSYNIVVPLLLGHLCTRKSIREISLFLIQMGYCIVKNLSMTLVQTLA